MFTNQYSNELLFPYASDYCMVFPKGLEKNRKIGKGSIVIEEDYIIYFKEDTPDDVKERFIKDYADYHRKEIESGIYYG